MIRTMAGDILKGRRILLISPQPWDHLPISKHHYAEELAADNDVTFLEPPGPAGLPVLDIRMHPTLDRLRIATWRSFTFKVLRFHAYGAYRVAMRRNAAWLTRRLGRPDLVWCFDFNVFPDLDAFGPAIRIFHPVDPLSSARQVAIGNSADLVISVSERILSNFEDTPSADRCLLINHGLSGPFADLARRPEPPPRDGPVQCGFFGNLDRPIIDLDRLKSVIAAHPKIIFHFWGPYSPAGLFAAAISGLGNVKAHGRMSKDILAEAAAKMDLFILAYIDHPTESDRSNAHKLLEYMSTGKIIVTTRMDCYDEDPDLLRMSSEPGDTDFSNIFTDTIASIETWNNQARVAKRKAFCQRFTYARNIEMIEAALATRI